MRMSSLPGTLVNRPPPLPASQRQLAESIREDLWFGDDDPERTAAEASRSLAAAAARAAGLKPFPVVAQRVMTLLADPEAVGDVGRALDRAALARFADVRGIRIEDDVLVTRTGHEVLTHVPKRLEDAVIG